MQTFHALCICNIYWLILTLWKWILAKNMINIHYKSHDNILLCTGPHYISQNMIWMNLQSYMAAEHTEVISYTKKLEPKWQHTYRWDVLSTGGNIKIISVCWNGWMLLDCYVLQYCDVILVTESQFSNLISKYCSSINSNISIIHFDERTLLIMWIMGC